MQSTAVPVMYRIAGAKYCVIKRVPCSAAEISVLGVGSRAWGLGFGFRVWGLYIYIYIYIYIYFICMYVCMYVLGSRV